MACFRKREESVAGFGLADLVKTASTATRVLNAQLIRPDIL